MSTRRGFLAATAALLLPPTLFDNAETVRRFWALDRTMLSPERLKWTIYDPDGVPMLNSAIAAAHGFEAALDEVFTITFLGQSDHILPISEDDAVSWPNWGLRRDGVEVPSFDGSVMFRLGKS